MVVGIVGADSEASGHYEGSIPGCRSTKTSGVWRSGLPMANWLKRRVRCRSRHSICRSYGAWSLQLVRGYAEGHSGFRGLCLINPHPFTFTSKADSSTQFLRANPGGVRRVKVEHRNEQYLEARSAAIQCDARIAD